VITTVLFDLDGTLSDSAPGILASLRHAFVRNGIAELTPEQERALLGPPFYESLPPLIGAERLRTVIADYREYYGARGMFDTVRYDGVLELVQGLRERGITLAVATSKPEPYAVPIVRHLGLGEAFTTVCGDTLDGQRDSKALVVGEALRRLGKPPASDVLMVGDRVHDVEGAAAHGVAVLGAGWGYGTPAELAGARAVFASAAELLAELPELLAAPGEGRDAATS
jgi:phosphoglycolate phosphatase